MNEINKNGFAAGLIVWLLIVIGFSGQPDCLNYSNCGRGDFILFGIISVAMIAPAWIVAMLISAMTKD